MSILIGCEESQTITREFRNNGRENRIHRMPPSKTRKRDRSITYNGIEKVIVSQWGKQPRSNHETARSIE